MWRFQGNAFVLIARATRSRSARMVDAVWQRLQCLVVSTLATNDVVDARLMQCTSRAATRCTGSRFFIACVGRLADQCSASAGATRNPRARAGQGSSHENYPIQYVSSRPAALLHEGRLPRTFFSMKKIGGDAEHDCTVVLPRRQDLYRTAMCTTHTNATQGLRQPQR